MPFIPLKINGCFEAIYSLYLQVWKIIDARNLHEKDIGWFSTESTALYLQKMKLFLTTAVGTCCTTIYFSSNTPEGGGGVRAWCPVRGKRTVERESYQTVLLWAKEFTKGLTVTWFTHFMQECGSRSTSETSEALSVSTWCLYWIAERT
jgi:hypothetical protein